VISEGTLDDDARVHECSALVRLLYEVVEHFLSHLKSAITPFFKGLTTRILPGVRPNIPFASLPTAALHR